MVEGIYCAAVFSSGCAGSILQILLRMKNLYLRNFKYQTSVKKKGPSFFHKK